MNLVFKGMNRDVISFVQQVDLLLGKFESQDFYQNLFEYAKKELPQTNAMLVYEYDEKDCSLKITQAWGFERDVRGGYSISAMEGICRKIFSSSVGELLTDSSQMMLLLKDIKHFINWVYSDGESKPQLPSSAVVLPIIYNETSLGVFVGIEFSPQKLFTSQNLAFFATVCKSIALRIRIKQMQEENYYMSEEISLLESVLKRDGDQTMIAGTLSSSMSALFLKGKEFAEMIELAAKHVTFPIALYNMFLEKLHGTDSSASRSLPSNILDLINLHGLAHKKEWQTLPVGNDFFCLIPIQFGGVMRGFLVAWLPCNDLSAKERTVLECLSCYLSFVWIKKAAVHEKNQNLKSEILSGILSDKQDDSLLVKANALGLSGGNKFFVLMVAVPGVDNHMVYSDKQECSCLIHVIESIISQRQMSCIAIPEHNDICVIISCKKAEYKNKRYDNIVGKVMSEISQRDGEIIISGSRVYDTIYNVRKCYWEAGQCLDIIKRYFVHRRCVNYIDVGVLRLLLTQNKEDVETYLEDILGPVMEYDQNRNTELLTTLFYYSRLNKSVRAVSGKLNIHANTIYQRIKKVEELLGYDFENPMDWFDIQSASIMYGLIYTNLITKI